MTYSIIANLTLHFESSASSTIAGKSDCDNCCIPITSLTQSKLLIMFKRTSGHSSLSCDKNNGSRCSIVLRTKIKNNKNQVIKKIFLNDYLLIFTKNGTEPHNNTCQSRFYMLIRISYKFLDIW